MKTQAQLNEINDEIYILSNGTWIKVAEGFEELRNYIATNLSESLQTYDEAIAYYLTHGWYSGLGSDLYELGFFLTPAQ